MTEWEPMERAPESGRERLRGDAFARLEGLGEMVRGLGTFILVATEAAVVAVDDFPEHEIGKYTDEYDYEEYKGHLVLAKRQGAKKVTCDDTVIIDWRRYRMPLPDPAGCSKLTGADVQISLDAEVQAATAAAEALCTDPNCTHTYTKILYQYWDCTHHIDQDTNKEVSELTIVIQLQLECRH